MNLTDELKIYEVSRIWKEVSYNFAYWDKVNINWDEEYKKTLAAVLKTDNIYDYYRELTRFVCLLNDGHSGISFPQEVMQSAEYYSMLPIQIWKFEEGLTVIAVTEALEDKIPLGSIIKKIDDTDVPEYLEKNVYPYIWHGHEEACGVSLINGLMFGRKGSRLKITFEKEKNIFERELTREDPTTLVWSKKTAMGSLDYKLKEISSSNVHKVQMTEDDIAIIRMTSFADDAMPEMIYADFDTLKKAKGYIIDVRGNSGGSSNNADKIAALFIDGDFKSCKGEMQVYEPTYKAWSMFVEEFKTLTPEEAKEKYADDPENYKAYFMGKNIFYRTEEGETVHFETPGRLNGPIVVLMNENTVSAAEDFVDVMKQYTDAVFVGGNTAGTSGQPLFIQLESGGVFRVCTIRCLAQNGEDIYNKGFSPDVRVVTTYADFSSGRDSAYEKGTEIIKSKLNG